METTEHRFTPAEPDAQAIIDNALRSAEPKEVDIEEFSTVVIPAGGKLALLDMERMLPEPRRKTGVYNFETVDSLVQYITTKNASCGGEHRSTIWIDSEQNRIVAVLNDHSKDGPGWTDYRAVLKLRHSPEWERWTALDRNLIDQQDFAEHIEDGLDDIVEPTGADMLELAQSMQGTTGVSWRSAKRLQDGQTQVVYDEQIDASAGGKGELVIPKEITLAIAPFQGEEPYKMVARFRYRVNAGTLKMGYHLNRPEAVIRDALQGIADRLTERFPNVYLGQPASPPDALSHSPNILS